MRTLWMVLIVCISVGELLPSRSAPMQWMGANVNDKVVHFGSYFLLGVLPILDRYYAGIRPALSMILLGVVLECLQLLVPGRSFDPVDLMANTVGVLGGIAAGLGVTKRHQSL